MGTSHTPLPRIPVVLLGMGSRGFCLLSDFDTAEPPESSNLTKKTIFWLKTWVNFTDVLVSRQGGVMVL